MGRRKNRHPRYSALEITDLTIEGKAVAKIPSDDPERGDLIIFVEDTVPGDIVDVQVKKRKKNYRIAYPTHFHKYSEDRREPFCSHFGLCGGCTRQMLPYDLQLKYKEKQIREQLERIGQIDLPEMLPILASDSETYYRNKLEFTFTDRRWLLQEEADSRDEITSFNGLGFHIPGRFDKVLNVDTCYLQPEPSNAIRNAVKQFADEQGYEFFFLREGTGFLRNLIIRTSLTGELMVILVVFEDDQEKITTILDFLKEKFPGISSLMYVVNPKKNDSIGDLTPVLYAGKDYITEQMGELKFKVGPKSFYQTNPQQAFELYKKVREFADLSGDELVYDLYTGTGTIAAFLASKAKKVVGIEYVEEAVQDARVNSEINGIENTVFYSGDMKDVFTETLFEKEGIPDVVVLDPPRAGMHKDVIKALLKAAPEKIVYVSCNPATQARDIQLLSPHYKSVLVQPVDMFPQTHHTENIVLLRKNFSFEK
jgi:23S rRNA (uracil1939-C5)-methyltransferase